MNPLFYNNPLIIWGRTDKWNEEVINSNDEYIAVLRMQNKYTIIENVYQDLI